MSLPTSYPRFGMVWCMPVGMKAWWLDLGEYGQNEVRKVLGHLPSLMQVNPCRELIEAATAFWDEKRVVFRFGEVEMTPLLEEIGGYVENVSLLWRNRKWEKAKMIIPKCVTLEDARNKLGLQGSDMVSFVMKGRMPGKYLLNLFGHSSSREIYKEDSSDLDSWTSRRIFAFMVYFLGMVVIPRGAEEDIDIRLISVVHALCNSIDKGHCTIVPMIVANIYRSLGRCKNGFKHFEGCNLLLQLWLIEHLQKVRGNPTMPRPTEIDHIAAHHYRVTMGVKPIKRPEEVEKWGQMLGNLTEDSVQWMFDWFPRSNFVVYTKYRYYLVLIGLRGLQPYSPMRTMRQDGRMQIIPRVADMDAYQVDYKDDFVPHALYIAKAWNKKVYLDEKSIEVDRHQAGYITGYIEWLHDDWAGTATASVKRGKHVEDKEAQAQTLYRRLKRKVQDSEACHRQLHDNNAKEIDEMGKELEYWKDRALGLDLRIQDLRDEFSKQGEECLNNGVMGKDLALAYLLSSRHHFDKVLEDPKKSDVDEDIFKI